MRKTRQFTAQDMIDRGLPEACHGGAVISDEIVDTRQDGVLRHVVFRLDEQPADEAYRVSYEESSWLGPWDHRTTVEADVVRATQKLVTVYEEITEDGDLR